eukprot:scaffold10723_cov113-Isochrysis_galbana.AAC.6
MPARNTCWPSSHLHVFTVRQVPEPPRLLMARYGDCVGDITGELVLVKPAKKAQRPDRSDPVVDARAVMEQVMCASNWSGVSLVSSCKHAADLSGVLTTACPHSCSASSR